MAAADEELPPPEGQRHVLQAEEELRIEIPFQAKSACKLLLQKGTCELWGVELAPRKAHVLTDGGFKLALFSWHGCVIDVESEMVASHIYTSDDTDCNVAYVNTHAQLEAIRDEALAASRRLQQDQPQHQSQQQSQQPLSVKEGPRVLIAGPAESGKSSIVKVLVAYAAKLGRTPVWMDLDPADNALTVPGTLAACPVTSSSVQVESFAATGIPPGTVAPLVLWHGSTKPSKDLFKVQVSALAKCVDERLSTDATARSSGLIVNTHSWIEDDGYEMLLHAVKALRINVVLVVGHDRLYSMFKRHVASAGGGKGDTAVKIIKLPRSDGVITRSKDFKRQCISRCMKRYFYGDSVESAAGNTAVRVPQLSPLLATVPCGKVTIYKFSTLNLSASLLPVASSQATESVQLEQVTPITEALQHQLVAVCHPQAVERYEQSRRAKDLCEAGVAGFLVVERVLTETDELKLLSPCAGSLPSHTFLVGDLTWME